MIPTIGIWLFDPLGIQSWSTVFTTNRGDGLLILSLFGEASAILALIALFGRPISRTDAVVNVAILVAGVVSYGWGFFVGAFMGMGSLAIPLTCTIAVIATVSGIIVRTLRRASS